MQKANYIVLDVETGGFSEKENPITEIAMIALNGYDLSEMNRLDFFIKNYDNLKVEKKALQVTGIKMSDIANGVEKRKGFKMIKDFVVDNSVNLSPKNLPIMVAHNSKFDKKFVKSFLERNNSEFTKLFQSETLCTQMMSKMFLGENKRLRLENCCERVGIKISNAHRAMNDTKATADLFRFYIKSMRNVEASSSGTSKKEQKSRVKFQF